MRWVHTVRLRLRSLVRRSRVEDELDEELRFHLDQHTRALTAQGVSKEDARYAALRAMGGVDQTKEACRDARRGRVVDNVLQDLRYAARIFRRSPGFTCVAILSLTLGIGANTAVFQLIDVIRLRNLPVARPQELMEVTVAGGHGGMGLNAGFISELTNPLWEQIRDHQQAFSGVFAWGANGILVGRGAQARVAEALWVSGDLFRVLRVAPARGRLFTAADDQRGCGFRAAVISYPFWQSYFGGQDSAIGQTLSLMGKPIEVVGVTPREFFGLEIGQRFDVALPMCSVAAVAGEDSGGNPLDQRHVWWLRSMGRLKPDWTAAAAAEHLRGISPGLFEATIAPGYEHDGATQRKYREFRLTATPAASGVSRLRLEYESSLWLLFGITALVLVIACANVANLMLARASVREHEMGVRIAIGASRTRIFAQLLTESLLLAAAGAALGAVLGNVLSHGLIAFLTTDSEALRLDMTLDWRTFTFAAAVGTLTCVVFGFVPAMRSSQIEPGAAMKSGGRGMTTNRGRFSFQRLLVVAQVAASLVLLVGAFLLVRSFRNLMTLDTGLRRDGIVFTYFADVSATRTLPDRAARVQATQAMLLERIRSIPRVDAAAVSTNFPLTGSSWTLGVRVVGPQGEVRNSSKFTYVSPGYFRTMEIGMLEGRDISELDTTTAPKVALVNEAFARTFFAGMNPLGRRVQSVAEPGYPEMEYEVIGTVKDTKYADLRDENPPIAYVPFTQRPNVQTLAGIVFRTRGPLADVIADVRRRVADVSPDIAPGFTVFETQIRDRLVRERVMAWLAGFFGGLAAALATIGLYGVISYIVARRRNEIGIRLALGAARGTILLSILREAALLVGVGLVAGGALALVSTRAAGALLFEMRPYDPPSFIAALLLLALVAIAASYVPARRAANADPTIALRCE